MSVFTWLFTLDHKRIGMIYVMLGVWGGFLGLSLSLLIRLNYLDPFYNVVSSEVYNHIITNHGITMIFFFLMPVLIGGFGNYLLPLLLGLPDLKLPRLKALSAWLLLPSSVCLGLSMLGGAGVGWTFYPPLCLSAFSSSGVDFLMFSLHMAGVSSMFGSLNFICTILTGMREGLVSRVSIIIWGYLFTSILLILSLPVLAAGITMILFDRKFSSSFFDPLGGGDPVLFQHLFWCAAHISILYYTFFFVVFLAVSLCFSNDAGGMAFWLGCASFGASPEGYGVLHKVKASWLEYWFGAETGMFLILGLSRASSGFPLGSEFEPSFHLLVCGGVWYEGFSPFIWSVGPIVSVYFFSESVQTPSDCKVLLGGLSCLS